MPREHSSATETRTDARKKSAQKRRKIDANTANKSVHFRCILPERLRSRFRTPKGRSRECPGRPRRRPRGPRELPEPPWSVPGTPPEHPRSSPGAPNACNRAPATSKRRPGTSKSSLRRPPAPHFGASEAYLPLFVCTFAGHSSSILPPNRTVPKEGASDIPARKFPGGGGESPQASSIET